MPMSPQFKKNCKLPDFFFFFFCGFLSNSIAEQHDAIKALCFSISLSAVSFYFISLAYFCTLMKSAELKYLPLSHPAIRLM